MAEDEPQIRVGTSAPSEDADGTFSKYVRDAPYLSAGEIKVLCSKDTCIQDIQRQIREFRAGIDRPTAADLKKAWVEAQAVYMTYLKLLQRFYNRKWRSQEMERLRLVLKNRVLEITEEGQVKKIRTLRAGLGKHFRQGSGKGPHPVPNSRSRSANAAAISDKPPAPSAAPSIT